MNPNLITITNDELQQVTGGSENGKTGDPKPPEPSPGDGLGEVDKAVRAKLKEAGEFVERGVKNAGDLIWNAVRTITG